MGKLDGKELYFKVLVWAYERNNSFTREELYEELDILSDDKPWIERVFFVSMPSEEPLFAHRMYIGEKQYFQLTQRGISAAISYLDLHEARLASLHSNRTASISIFIAVVTLAITIVGLFVSYKLQIDALELTRLSVESREDPLFSYRYENEKFIVDGASDVRIESVSWAVYGVYENQEKFIVMLTAGNYLPLGQLKNSYLIESLDGYSKMYGVEYHAGKAIDFIKCFQLIGHGDGIPVYVHVKYKIRGEEQVHDQIDLVYIKGHGNGEYFVDVYISKANSQQTQEFLEESLLIAGLTIRISGKNETGEYKEYCGTYNMYNPEPIF